MLHKRLVPQIHAIMSDNYTIANVIFILDTRQQHDWVPYLPVQCAFKALPRLRKYIIRYLNRVPERSFQKNIR